MPGERLPYLHKSIAQFLGFRRLLKVNVLPVGFPAKRTKVQHIKGGFSFQAFFDNVVSALRKRAFELLHHGAEVLGAFHCQLPGLIRTLLQLLNVFCRDGLQRIPASKDP